MNRRVLLIGLLCAGLAAAIGYGLYGHLGPHKNVSQETGQVKSEVATSQTPAVKITEEIGEVGESIRPEEETVASVPSESAGLILENGSDIEQFLESSSDLGASRLATAAGVESQTTQVVQDSEPTGLENSESREESKLAAEALPKSLEETRASLGGRGDGSAEESPTTIQRSAITVAVENLEPKGISEHVSVRQGRVYCWVHVTNGEGKKITVRWIAKGKELWQTELPIGSNDWRTWAYITLRPGMIGPAQADILNEDGELLQTEAFEITG